MADWGADAWLVSPFAQVSWRAGRIELGSAVSGAALETDNPDLLRAVHAFARAASVEDVLRTLRGYDPEESAACIDALIEAGVLIKAAEAEAMTGHHWERAALAYHTKSRQPGFRKKSMPTTSPDAGSRSGRAIPLDRPVRPCGRDLADVLESRRSQRAWPKRAITGERFSSLLWLSARNRQLPSNDCGGVSRPYPSGGAVYSLELYPILAASAVESISAGVYRYLPASHSLEPLSNDADDYVPFLDAAGRSAASACPPVVIVITSRYARQSEVYGDLAYSLVLKEVGGLFQTLYLVSEYLDLASCALGGGAPDELLASLCGTTQLAEPVVGEFMVGPSWAAVSPAGCAGNDQYS
jgi:SagB-type dehydrogenase family enzyme